MKYRANAGLGGSVSGERATIVTGVRTAGLDDRLNFPKGDQLRCVIRLPVSDRFSVVALAGARVFHCVLLNYTHRLGLPSTHAITTQ